MIVVLGRPAARSLPSEAGQVPDGTCVAIARAAVAAGARVELVGSVGDDDVGDAVVVGLGREGIGHAALLRDPRAATPIIGHPPHGPAPDLERADVELGLSYLADYGVLVLAEQLDDAAQSAALDAAAYHGAQVIAAVPRGAVPEDRLAAVATVLESPEEDVPAFAAMLGRHAAELDRGAGPREGLTRAATAAGWEPRG